MGPGAGQLEIELYMMKIPTQVKWVKLSDKKKSPIVIRDFRGVQL